MSARAWQTLENIKTVLEAAGASIKNVLKITCYVADLGDKKAFDDVYVGYFPKTPRQGPASR